MKSISNKTKTNNKIIQVNEVNIDLERKLKKKKPLLQIIKDFSNVSFNHKDAIKINPDELFFSQINSVNRNLLAKNKKPLKLKKLKIKSIKNIILFNFLNIFPNPKIIVPQPNESNIIIENILLL